MDENAGNLPFGASALAELIALLDAGTLTSKIAKEVFDEMWRGGGSPKAIIEKRGIQQITDAGALDSVALAVLAESADAVARYRAGNQNLLGVFVGLAMKKTGGKANAKLLQEVLKKKLGAMG